jgi:Zinc knuckle
MSPRASLGQCSSIKLIAIQQQPREVIAEYFERAQHLRNQLISAGGHMDEHAFAMALINGLREEFEIAITMLTTPHTAKQLTAELIRPGLLAYEARMASRHSMQRERSEAMAYAAGGKSYGMVSSRPAATHKQPCGGQRGSMHHSDWQRPNRQPSGRKETSTCHRCGKSGHLARDCTQRSEQAAEEHAAVFSVTADAKLTDSQTARPWEQLQPSAASAATGSRTVAPRIALLATWDG